MTSNELAEKIAWKCADAWFSDGGDQALINTAIEVIESLLRAHEDQLIERCAKIIENFNLPDGNEFYWYKQKEAAVKAIRQLKLEVKK